MSDAGDQGVRGQKVEPTVPESVIRSRPIDWTEMKWLLEQVAERLDPDEPVDMWIAGGSALASADLRLSTMDVDVVSDVPEVVYEVARDLAGKAALPSGWLNASARSFLPRGATATKVFGAGPLTVRRVSHDDLFIMKLDRGLSGDVADMRVLWRHASYIDGQAAVDDYVERHYMALIDRDPLERIQERSVEPRDPSAQVESVRLERGARVAGQEPGNSVLDTLADRVGLDQDELADDFAGMDSGGIHDDGSLADGGDSTYAHTTSPVKVR